MNIDELAEDLKQIYTPERGYGITKLINPEKEWENIYFVVPKVPISEVSGSLPHHLLNEALKVIGSLPRVNEMSELDKLINFLFVKREVVQSSRLEGTWSTIDHALTPGDIADENEGESEHQAVRSYANLLENIVAETIDKKESIFTKKFICHVHKSIVEKDPKSKGLPGKLRTEGEPGSIVTIGGAFRKENSIYNPAPAFAVEKCLKDVINWLKDDKIAQLGDAGIGGMSLPVRLAIGHSHFEAVHPFTDGNGRTGRALWPIQMVCSGYMPLYLSGYVEAFKDQYAKALGESQKKLNYVPIIEFICNAIIDSSIENKKTKEAISKLENSWQERGKFRKNSGPRKALKLLLEKPIITAAIIEQELGISKTASIDTVNVLSRKKIIRLRRKEKRTNVFAAEELIQLLSRNFGEDVDVALEKAHILLELNE